MIVTYLLLTLLILLAAHLIVLPFSKRRPFILKGLEGSLFVVILISFAASLSHQIIYFIALAIGLSIYYTKCWIVFGVSLENVTSALEKSILATRATNTKTGNTYEIDNSMSIKIRSLGMKISSIHYKNKALSKKSELTKEIFRKFIQNYFI